MSSTRISFVTSFDPRGLSPRAEKAKFDIMTDLEELEGFNREQLGCLNTVLMGLSRNNIFNFWLPLWQMGFPNLFGRPRERCFPFERMVNGKWAGGGPPKITRRSANLYWLGRQFFLEYVESSLDRNYHYEARRLLNAKFEICRKEILHPQTKDYEFLQMLLLPIELEKARLRYLLSGANRFVRVSRQGPLRFLAEFEDPLERNDVQCLAATVGEKVVLQIDEETEELFVSSMSPTGLILKYPVNTDFTSTHNTAVRVGPAEDSFLDNPQRLRVRARFYMSPLAFKVLSTSVVDGVTGCGGDWFGRSPVLMCGLPLIPLEKIEKAKNREGLFNPNISDQQLAFVILALTNALERGILFCLGAAGTGKTNALDELIFQVSRHHQEDCNGSALIFLVQPTNEAVTRTAYRLIRKGYPAGRLLIVRGEQAYNSGAQVDGIECVRVTNYYPDDGKQVLIGTPQVLARVRLHRENTVGVMLKPPLLVVLDEVCSYTVMAALGPMTMSGQAGLTVCAGDPNQIEPQWLSRTAQYAFGNTTLVDAAMRKPGTFETHCRYPTPTPRNGVLLTQNHRATTFLVNLAAPFYDGQLTTSNSTNEHDTAAACLMKSLTGVQYVEGMHTFLWLNIDTPCHKHELSDSWFNRGEARLAARVTDEITSVVSDRNVLLVSGYSEQVNLMKSFINQQRSLAIGSVDQCQGYECNIVIASLVRTSKGDGNGRRSLGFMVDPNRVNTMITRGKLLVILIGSADYFRNGDCKYWSYLLDKASIRNIID